MTSPISNKFIVTIEKQFEISATIARDILKDAVRIGNSGQRNSQVEGGWPFENNECILPNPYLHFFFY